MGRRRSKGRVNLLQTLKTASRGAFQITGVLEVDLGAFAEEFAVELAAQIRNNLSSATRPDGKGAMPGRKSDGRPRGEGAAIVQTIAAAQKSETSWTIAAVEDVPGHLRRILKKVPLRPSSKSAAWQAALAAAMAELLTE